ncbi:putative transcriptional regulator [Anoxybacillus calidus]|uniref:Putative transcriptional regulator n=1 Tax=[Anoxybacillus] calidus TaxID=575178 RepID=A0A7W0BTA7_9BACL|nr:helix-turn-helix transcriptional regulator [Anoxybacillus calidus]MBA2869976.1 putative transcriptional regulator [Anoxybacillus calidus]
MARKIRLKLREILKERDIEQKQLAEKAKVTERAISELCNDKVKRYTKETLERIADALEIDDISELIEIVHEKSEVD